MPELAQPWEVWLVAATGGFSGAAIFYCYIAAISDPRIHRALRRVCPWARRNL